MVLLVVVAMEACLAQLECNQCVRMVIQMVNTTEITHKRLMDLMRSSAV